MDWSTLTRIPHKIGLYARETYFREGWGDAQRILGAAAADIVRDSALLMVKPDGLAAGKTGEIADFLAEHGFVPRAVEVIALDGLRWRELWRYQLTSATLDRLAVNDLVLQGDALLMLLRQRGAHALPATVRLSGLKGPADPARQSAGCLRRRLQQPNRVFSFVHVADEPADLLREMRLLPDDRQRPRLWEALGGAGLSEDDQAVLDLHCGGAARALDVDAALDRMQACIGPVQYDEAPGLVLLRDALARMRRRLPVEWRAFAHALSGLDMQVDPWDLAILGAHSIICDEAGEPKLIEGVDPARWLQDFDQDQTSRSS